MPVRYRTLVLNDAMRAAALTALEECSRTGDTYASSQTQRFERELGAYVKRRYAVAANSGTSALMLALQASRLGPGDEVIVAANSYLGVLSAIERLDLTPVFVDCDEGGSNVDIGAIAGVVTRRTRAVIPIHYYGFPCDMDALMASIDRRTILVIEDAAHALGAEYKKKPVGGIGDLAFFSFSGKMVATFGPGGAMATDDVDLAERFASLRDQGRTQTRRISFTRAPDPSWRSIRQLGYNMQMPEICAALGRVQLRMLPTMVARRRENAAQLTERFRDARLPLRLPPEREWARPCYLHYVIMTPRRDELKAYLQARRIESTLLYPTPLHRMDFVREKYHTAAGQFPAAERWARENLSLPVGPHLSGSMVDYVADSVVAYFRRHRLVA